MRAGSIVQGAADIGQFELAAAPPRTGRWPRTAATWTTGERARLAALLQEPAVRRLGLLLRDRARLAGLAQRIGRAAFSARFAASRRLGGRRPAAAAVPRPWRRRRRAAPQAGRGLPRPRCGARKLLLAPARDRRAPRPRAAAAAAARAAASRNSCAAWASVYLRVAEASSAVSTPAERRRYPAGAGRRRRRERVCARRLRGAARPRASVSSASAEPLAGGLEFAARRAARGQVRVAQRVVGRARRAIPRRPAARRRRAARLRPAAPASSSASCASRVGDLGKPPRARRGAGGIADMHGGRLAPGAASAPRRKRPSGAIQASLPASSALPQATPASSRSTMPAATGRCRAASAGLQPVGQRATARARRSRQLRVVQRRPPSAACRRPSGETQASSRPAASSAASRPARWPASSVVAELDQLPQRRARRGRSRTSASRVYGAGGRGVDAVLRGVRVRPPGPPARHPAAPAARPSSATRRCGQPLGSPAAARPAAPAAPDCRLRSLDDPVGQRRERRRPASDAAVARRPAKWRSQLSTSAWPCRSTSASACSRRLDALRRHRPAVRRAICAALHVRARRARPRHGAAAAARSARAGVPTRCAGPERAASKACGDRSDQGVAVQRRERVVGMGGGDAGAHRRMAGALAGARRGQPRASRASARAKAASPRCRAAAAAPPLRARVCGDLHRPPARRGVALGALAAGWHPASRGRPAASRARASSRARATSASS